MNLVSGWTDKRKRILTAAAFLILLLLQMALLCCFGQRKQGFHEDELYSYYSTNKTAGLFVNDREWVERDDFRNDFVVLKGEQFRYGIVKQMQSWDVHPPLYYYLLHTVCSLFPGVFSKWLGIAVNMAAFVLCYFLLAYLVYQSTTGEKRISLAFAVCMFWGFSAAVISGVMFIRMYQWLTLFVLLCACLHVRALRKQNYGAGFLIPLGFTVFLGFMTQYYYIIFHFFMGAGMCFLLIKNKRIKELFCYAFSCGIGLLAAICYYPASLSHIFRGYRGTEAVSEFSNAENTFDRLRFFAGLFDKYVVNESLYIWLLFICILGVTAAYLRKKDSVQKDREKYGEESRTRQIVGLLLFACGGYFFTVSKTALLLGETSNRYQLPIYGILLFFMIYFLYTPFCILVERHFEGRMQQSGAEKWYLAGGIAVIAAILLTDGSALADDRTFFLYEEEGEIIEYIKANHEVPVVILYNEASPDNVWRLSDELMEFPGFYLAGMGNPEAVTDETIVNSDKLIVYAADHNNKEECLEGILNSSKKLDSCQVIAKKGLWTLYELDGKQ